jgi:hypothetical protein
MDTGTELSFVSAPAAYSGAWLAANWPIIEAVAAGANLSAALHDPLQVLTPAEARTMAAFAERVVPDCRSAEARDGGAVHFIDRALNGFARALMPAIRAAVRELDSSAARADQRAESFADLTVNEQLQVIKTLETRECFASARLLALLGVFANPLLGGKPGDVLAAA